MSIKDLGEKIKSQGESLGRHFSWSEIDTKYYTALIILLVGLGAFGLGRLSAGSAVREPITIEKTEESRVVSSSNSASVAQAVKTQLSSTGGASAGSIVASKTGTKYYYPWCGGVNNIADKNKVWFNSVDEARANGYTPASNCKGLK